MLRSARQFCSYVQHHQQPNGAATKQQQLVFAQQQQRANFNTLAFVNVRAQQQAPSIHEFSNEMLHKYVHKVLLQR